MQSKQLSDYSPAKITSEKLFVKKKKNSIYLQVVTLDVLQLIVSIKCTC